MYLQNLIDMLESAPEPERLRKLGLKTPHSWRGSYAELAFEPAENVSVLDMLAAARSALGSTYCGWKGGQFTMHEFSECYLAEQGDIGEELGATLLSYMLRDFADEPIRA